MRVKEDFIIREIAGEHILIPVGETALKIHGMINMTESGILLFEKLQKGCSREDLIQVILEEYDVDEECAETDVETFLNKLRNLNLLEGE